MHRLTWTRAALATALLVGTSTNGEAQKSGDGYRFGAPDATITLRGGYAYATAGSDIFDEATTRLTLDKRDFSGVTLGADVAVHITSRIDLLLSGAFSRSKAGSEFRNFIGSDSLPIEQTTTFERAPVTAGLKYYFTPTGRSIGRTVWIPARFAPYVGVGAGAMHYRFRQEGEFVNFQNNGIFASQVESTDWALVGQGLIGADYSISPSLGFNVEVRYLGAKSDLGEQFSGYQRIDLSGASATVGLSIRL
jgi:hypothetical protein